jgi:hypothetical protein
MKNKIIKNKEKQKNRVKLWKLKRNPVKENLLLNKTLHQKFKKQIAKRNNKKDPQQEEKEMRKLVQNKT